MILYSILDKDANEYELNGTLIDTLPRETLTYQDDDISFENKIVEKSGNDGATKLGETRIAGKTLSLELVQYYDSMDDFRLATNTLGMNLKKAVYLLDKTNEIRTEISVKDFSIRYTEGSHKIAATISIKIEMLQPYWESEDYIEVTDTLLADINDVAIDNDGFIETAPIITFEATSAVDDIEMYIDENGEGIKILDDLFGTTGYEEMIVNCKTGSIMIGNVERNISIAPGTGFFKLPIGSSTLKIIPSAGCDVTIQYKELEYV